MKLTPNRSYEVTSRLRDLIVASVVGAITAPIWVGAAVAVRTTMGRPILFRQLRPGRSEKSFLLMKFRTMSPAPPDAGPESDSVRITPVGNFLRRTSIDELPTLLNVLNGDMGLVGPRPLLMRYLDRYSARQRRRHEVRPGITGWAQVNGRNALSWEEKFELDLWYVDHRSQVLDLKILGMTLLSVLRRRGISADDHATMPEFLGSVLDESG